jgi:hypothetical protein
MPPDGVLCLVICSLLDPCACMAVDKYPAHNFRSALLYCTVGIVATAPQSLVFLSLGSSLNLNARQAAAKYFLEPHYHKVIRHREQLLIMARFSMALPAMCKACPAPTMIAREHGVGTVHARSWQQTQSAAVCIQQHHTSRRSLSATSHSRSPDLSASHQAMSSVVRHIYVR